MTDARGRDLAEFLCSRLCHDLAGALGAIANGVELIEELGGAADAETLALLRQSAATAVGRLQFFRLAYGSAGNATPETGFEAALGYLRAFLPQRTTLEAKLGTPPPRPGPGAVKLMLNTVLLAVEALPRGGVVRVAIDDAACLSVDAVAAAGGAAKLDEGALAALDHDPAPGSLTYRTAHAGYLGRVARNAGCGLAVRHDAGAIGFSLRLPPG